MKNVILILFLTNTILLHAQNSGIINYVETITIEIDKGKQPDGMDLSKFLPNNLTVYKALSFDDQKSIYKGRDAEEKNEETSLASDDGEFKIEFITEDKDDNALFTDMSKMKTIELETFMGKKFIIEEKLPKYNWKLTGEKISYLDYECHKATLEHDDKKIVAWFTPQIPQQVGPDIYNQLPGAILMLSINEGKTEIKATEVIIGEHISEVIKAPNNGKKVTAKELDKIIEEKTKELSNHFGSGATIINN